MMPPWMAALLLESAHRFAVLAAKRSGSMGRSGRSRGIRGA